MANTKEIKTRINSVKDTQKITNAMQLIASTKLRKAKAELDETRPYFDALRREIKRIFRVADGVKSKYFFPADGSEAPDENYGVLVITADKGLAGAYNHNVLKEAMKLVDTGKNIKLYVVGEYGRQYFLNHRIPIEQSFLYTAQNPTMRSARAICDLLLEDYEEGRVDRVFIVYTDMKSSLSAEATSVRLLPFHRSHFTGKDEKPLETEFEFNPSPEAVLDIMVESYMSGFIYSALIDSFCSEQNARMTAMDSANQNAEKILGELSVQYNRVRQGAITQEITEVSAGAKAQKKKREREEAEK